MLRPTVKRNPAPPAPKRPLRLLAHPTRLDLALDHTPSSSFSTARCTSTRRRRLRHLAHENLHVLPNPRVAAGRTARGCGDGVDEGVGGDVQPGHGREDYLSGWGRAYAALELRGSEAGGVVL